MDVALGFLAAYRRAPEMQRVSLFLSSPNPSLLPSWHVFHRLHSTVTSPLNFNDSLLYSCDTYIAQRIFKDDNNFVISAGSKWLTWTITFNS